MPVELTEVIDYVLGQEFTQVISTGARIARIRGHLWADVEAGGEDGVDAMVVATPIRVGGGIVLTRDLKDLSRLVASQPNVSIVSG